MSKQLALVLLAVAGLCSAIALGCESDTSPGGRSDNPPPPPSHTPSGLRHGTGVLPTSGELSEEEAAKLLGETPDAAGAEEEEEGAERTDPEAD